MGEAAHFFLTCELVGALKLKRRFEARMRNGVVVASAVRELIEPTITGLGYELVDVERSAHGLLRVTVDTQSPDRGVGLDDCERISRQLTHLMAVEQIDYERLEVSSPGLDRPLVRPRDFVRFAGSQVQVELRELLQGRRRFRGMLLGLEGESGAERVWLAVGFADRVPGGARAGAARGRKPARPEVAQAQETLELPLAAIEKARLVPQFDFRGRARSTGALERADG
jgi:ribosome maturation factor RimP